MSIDDPSELTALRRVGRLVAHVRDALAAAVAPGVRPTDLDALGARLLREGGGRSAPRHERGFPADILISVGDAVVHGVPTAAPLRAGQLVTIDVTAELDGFVADSAVTVGVGPIDARRRGLILAAEAAFACGLEQLRAGAYLRGVGRAIEAEVRRRGFRVLPQLAGHGTGRRIHEEPIVPNVDDPSLRLRLTEGLVLAVEPIVTAGGPLLSLDADGWTVRTVDRAPTAHHEHTVVVTDGAPLILTAA